MLFAELERNTLQLTDVAADTVVQVGVYELGRLTRGGQTYLLEPVSD
jgi:hypothetical protein